MSERLDRIEAIFITVAEQTADNSRSILGINQTMQVFAQEQVTLNRTMQVLAQEQVTLNQSIQAVAQQTSQNSRDIADLRSSIADLRDVVEQQNRGISYLMSKD